MRPLEQGPVRPQAAVLVTKVRTEADADGVLAEVAVQRFPTGLRPFGVMPKAADLPPDVRDALRAWLDADVPEA